MVLRLAKSTFLITLFFILLLMASSCGISQEKATAIEVTVPEGKYLLQEVIPDGGFLLGDSAGNNAWISEGYFILDGNEMKALSLPDDPLCHRIRYERPGMLPDGRLGFVKFCLKWPDRPVGQSDEYTLVAYDLTTGEVEQIMEEAIYGKTRLGNFTWNPDMTRGIMQEGDLDGTLYWVTSDGPEPMDVMITEGRRSWSLADMVTNWFNKEMDSTLDIPTGIADEPAWSPDGQTIAFVASPKALDYDGIRRANVPYNLYFMSPETLEPVKMLEGIMATNLLKWSPDSDLLLMDGCMGLIRQCGLWIFQPEEARLELVTTGDFEEASWVSNHEIATNYCVRKDITCEEFKLMQYDISDMVNSDN